MRVQLAAPRDDLAAVLSGLGAIADSVSTDEAVIRVTGGAQAEAALLARLIGAGLAVRAFIPVRRTLEQTYLDEARRPASLLKGDAA